MQDFNSNDDLEKRIRNLIVPILSVYNSEKTVFFDEAYESYRLGDILYDLDASPLAGNISKDIFRTSYFAIHQLYTRPGTFEFYLDVFRALFGDDVDVEFVIPAPGKLLINIDVLSIQLVNLQARRIEDGAYVYYDLVTETGDNIVAQVTQGPRTQSEIDAIMIELKPQGIWVETTLVIS